MFGSSYSNRKAYEVIKTSILVILVVVLIGISLPAMINIDSTIIQLCTIPLAGIGAYVIFRLLARLRVYFL